MSDQYKRNSTCIFSYNKVDHEVTLTQAQLVQTFPLSRTTPIDKTMFTIGKNQDNDIVLFDEFVSGYHCKIEFRDSKFFLKDLQSTNGTFLNQQKVIEAELSHRAVLEVGKAKFNFNIQQTSKTVEPMTNQHYFCGMVSHDPAMKEVFGLIKSLEASNAPAFIHGATGTGKELVARAIHENSSRKSGRFIAVNCGAIAKELIESELFGHEKGSFTGAAAQREGLFELADGGTLFLDEIGELPLDLQPKLLRVLETGEIRRVGSSKNLNVNVRVIAATHRDLADEVRQQRFREDLYYRIYVLPITLPTLNDRRDDIPYLAEHFLNKAKTLSKAALDKLMAHTWPGNIRELKNTLERALVISHGKNEIEPAHIQYAQSTSKQPTTVSTAGATLEEIEKMAIIDALKRNHWKKTETAQKLGIAKSTLHEKLKKYGISEESSS